MRKKIWLLAAMLGALVSVVAIAAAHGGEPVKQPRYIAVVGFENLRPGTDTDWIGAGAAETLTTKLCGVPGLVAVERSQIRKIIDEQDFQQSDLSGPSSAVKVGRLVGAERVVMGSFAAEGDGLLFNARVVDVKTATVLNAASATGRREEVFDLFNRLAEAVIESFEKKVVVVGERPVVEESPQGQRIVLTDEQKRLLEKRGTTNLGAYEAYAKGVASKDFAEAMRLFTEAIELDPQYLDAYIYRATFYGLTGQYVNALSDHNKAVKIAPDNWVVYNNRAVTYDMMGELDLAVRDYDKAIDLRPDHPGLYNSRGVAYGHKGDYNRAIADCTRAIELKADLAEAYNNRGIACANKGDYDRAIADYTRAIELKADLAEAYNNRGNAYGYKGDYDCTIGDCTRAIKLKPDYAMAYYDRAVSYFYRDDYDKAWADVKRCQRLGYKVPPGFLEALRKASGRSE